MVNLSVEMSSLAWEPSQKAGCPRCNMFGRCEAPDVFNDVPLGQQSVPHSAAQDLLTEWIPLDLISKRIRLRHNALCH